MLRKEYRVDKVDSGDNLNHVPHDSSKNIIKWHIREIGRCMG